MSTSTSDLFTTIPATHDEPEIHIRLRRLTTRAVLTARSPEGDGWRTVAATTAPLNAFKAALIDTPDGPVLQLGVLTVPLTAGMRSTILGWDPQA